MFAFQNVLGRERLAVVSERGKVERLADKPWRVPGLIAAKSSSLLLDDARTGLFEPARYAKPGRYCACVGQKPSCRCSVFALCRRGLVRRGDQRQLHLPAVQEADLPAVEEGVFLGAEIHHLATPFGHGAIGGQLN